MRTHVNDPRMAHLLEPFQSELKISYITYARYTDTNIQLYSSFLPLMQGWLDDESNKLPNEVSDSTKTLKWKDYCSEAFLSRCQNSFSYSPQGATIYFQHSNHAEHIALASNHDLDISKILLENPRLTNQLTNHIRNSINLNKESYSNLMHVHHLPCTLKTRNQLPEAIQPIKRKRHYVYGYKGDTFITNSEMQCLTSILRLKTYKEIASELNVSTKTIEAHIAKIKQKLGAQTKSDLYNIATSNLIT